MSENPSRRRWSSIFRRAPTAEVDEELRFHLEERIREYVAGGMEPEAARAAALERMGELDRVRGECVELLSADRRTEARMHRLRVSILDFKLAFRMLVKHPGLTIVSVLTISVALGGAAAFFAFTKNLFDPTIPLENGDRMVSFQQWSLERNQAVGVYLNDFAIWRDALESVEDLGAFVVHQRNLITEDGRSEPASGSEMSASGFRVARVPPLLGRHLVEADERLYAPAVAVIGHDLWQDRFEGDPRAVGRIVQIGATPHTIVGVMPEGFRFPFTDNFWTPLREDPVEWARMEGPRAYAFGVFGRLGDGIALAEAQAELDVIGRRSAQDFPETHAILRPEIVRFGNTWTGSRMLFHASRSLWVILLLLVCANVGALTFARNVAREGEVAVRAALGASRVRIVSQFFVEALVLSAIAAIIGLALGHLVAGVVSSVFAEERRADAFGGLPFWWRDGLAPGSAYYVAGLTLLSAVVIGILPALSLTRARLLSRLQGFGAGAASARFSRTARLAIVGQMGICVVLFGLAIEGWPSATNDWRVDGLAAEEYLTAELMLDDGLRGSEGPTAFYARYLNVRGALAQRLAAESAVRGVTFASHLPGTEHPFQRIEIDETNGRDESFRVPVARVDAEFFAVMGAPVLAGRAFDTSDIAADGTPRPVAVVNRSFAEGRFGGGSAIGRRVRFANGSLDDEPGPWLEVVGIVDDLGMNLSGAELPEGLYVPLAPTVYPVMLGVRLATEPAQFTARLGSVGASVDPGLRLMFVTTLDTALRAARTERRLGFLAVALPSLAVLLLSLCAIYSVMSFFVSRRTREIGIRIALGARPSRVVFDIFSRAFRQLSLGVGIAAVVVLLPLAMEGGSLAGALTVSGLMMAAGLLACAAPTWRALRVQPTQALKADG